ncbi:MAG: PQQ-binding-like beta-propeller repeat protein [Planctomycetota bacterium]
MARTNRSTMPEPPNPAPPPFSGPRPVTGSGRTAWIVPTFVGPNANRRGGTLRGADGGATMEASAVGTQPPQDDLTMPRGGSARSAGTRRAVSGAMPMGGGGGVPATMRGAQADYEDSPYDQPYGQPQDVSPYAPTVAYDDDQQAAWDRDALAASDRVPATVPNRGGAGPRPTSAARAGGASGRSARSRAAGGGKSAPKKSNAGLIATLVIVLLVGIGLGVWFFILPGNTAGNNTDGTGNLPPIAGVNNNGKYDNSNVNNAGTPGANGKLPTPGKAWCEWVTVPPKFTNTARFRYDLRVNAPAPVTRITLNATELRVPPGDGKSFTLPIDIDLANEPTENFTLRLTAGSHEEKFPFVVFFDDKKPTVTLVRPVPMGDTDSATARTTTVEVEVRITDNVLLRRVIVTAGDVSKTEEFTEDEKRVTHSWKGNVRFDRDGRWPVRVEATDGAGSTVQWTGFVTVDSRPPQVRFEGQPAGTRQWRTGTEMVALRGAVLDPGGRPASLQIDGYPVPLTMTGGGEQATFLWERRLQPGANSFRVEATDQAGNVESFTLVLDFVPDQPPVLGQVDIDGTRVWSQHDGAPLTTIAYRGENETVLVEMYFDALGRETPTATLNDEPAEVNSSGGSWLATGRLQLTGEETPVTIGLAANGKSLSVSFRITRTPFALPVMPLHRVKGVKVARSFPPSGNVELDPERFAVDFVPGEAGGVLVLMAGGSIGSYDVDGAERWTARLPDGLRPDALRRVGNTLVVRGAEGELVLLDGSNGALRRRLLLRSAPGSAITSVDDNRIAVQRADGTVCVYDLASDSSVEFPAPGRPSGPLVAIGGRYLLLGRGGVSALHLTLRRPVWQSPVAATDIVLLPDGRIAVAEVSGRVYLMRGFGAAPDAEATLFADGGRIVPLPGGGLLAVGRSIEDPAVTHWVRWKKNPLTDAGTTADGPMPEALRVGPDGSVWCMISGYVCRLADK